MVTAYDFHEAVREGIDAARRLEREAFSVVLWLANEGVDAFSMLVDPTGIRSSADIVVSLNGQRLNPIADHWYEYPGKLTIMVPLKSGDLLLVSTPGTGYSRRVP